MTSLKLTPEDVSKFWKKVDKAEACWLWTGTPGSSGYGRFWVNRKCYYAHRVSLIISNGSLSPDLDVDHKCHNRLCVNPSHLAALPHKQNMENQSGPHRRNKSGFRGVSWDKEEQLWRVQVRHNNRTYFFGRYANLEEAARVAKEARLSLFTNNLLDRV